MLYQNENVHNLVTSMLRIHRSCGSNQETLVSFSHTTGTSTRAMQDQKEWEWRGWGKATLGPAT